MTVTDSEHSGTQLDIFYWQAHLESFCSHSENEKELKKKLSMIKINIDDL